MDERDIEAHAGRLADRSYTVLEGLHEPAKVARLRAAVLDTYARLGRPPLHSKIPEWVSPNVEVSGTGLVLHELLGFAPQLEDALLHPDLVAILRRVLGPDMFLEFVAAVIADHTRPFFEWHNHVGGIDDEKFRREGLRPAIETAQRVAALVYLDPMGPGTGQLLIHPHRVSGRSGPPRDVSSRHWEGQLEVGGPAGTTVMMDQCCWHAVLPRTIDREPRIFVGLWFSSAAAPKAERVDAALQALDPRDPLLASVLAARRRA